MKNKTKFKAPVEHAALLACFILIWLGPALKLVGILTCSWWMAFVALWSVWALAALVFVVDALVGVEQADAHRLQEIPK
jgi:hypothetical protein